MIQPALFDLTHPDTPPIAHAADPDTSHEAARKHVARGEGQAMTINLTPYCGHIPPMLLLALEDYATKRIPTGDFLRSVLSNDLMRAVGHADPDSFAAIKAICQLVYQELPGNCHGSPEAVRAWLEAGRRQRLEESQPSPPTCPSCGRIGCGGGCVSLEADGEFEREELGYGPRGAGPITGA